jgi:hypothetical protein
LNRAGELLAGVDQCADEEEDAAEGSRHGGVGPGQIGVSGRRGALSVGRHNHKENTKAMALSRNNFLFA